MNKKKKETSPWTGIVIVLAALIMGAADGSIALLLIAIIAAIVVIVSAAAKKQTGAANVWKSPADAKTRMDAHEMKTAAYSAKDESRQPLHCTCSRGKQRYLDQAAMFYKNGLIDRSEYNVMCEKYNKLNIPEDI